MSSIGASESLQRIRTSSLLSPQLALGLLGNDATDISVIIADLAYRLSEATEFELMFDP